MEWENRTYKVDKILSVRETYSRAGGCGMRYECRFGSQVRRLFWEKDRWFLESTIYIPAYQQPPVR